MGFVAASEVRHVEGTAETQVAFQLQDGKADLVVFQGEQVGTVAVAEGDPGQFPAALFGLIGADEVSVGKIRGQISEENLPAEDHDTLDPVWNQ